MAARTARGVQVRGLNVTTTPGQPVEAEVEVSNPNDASVNRVIVAALTPGSFGNIASPASIRFTDPPASMPSGSSTARVGPFGENLPDGVYTLVVAIGGDGATAAQVIDAMEQGNTGPLDAHGEAVDVLTVEEGTVSISDIRLSVD